MLKRILDMFQAEIQPENQAALGEEQKHIACAALLIEVATIDNHFDDSEFKCLQVILEKNFAINKERSQQLIEAAQTEKQEASSTYQFTQLVNQTCSHEDKLALVLSMWKIAFADGTLDKYEEYIIRKVSDLIYISHSEFIQAKQIAHKQINE